MAPSCAKSQSRARLSAKLFLFLLITVWVYPCAPHLWDGLNAARLDLQTPTRAPPNRPNHSQMSFTAPRSKQLPLKLPRSEEELLSALSDNQGLLATSDGSSTLEARHVYEQTEPRFSSVQVGLQPEGLAHEASATESYNYNQPYGTGGHLDFTANHRKRTMGCRARAVCAYCNKSFGRVQELRRHLNEKHMPPRRCPFCNFPWTRPNGMKVHLVARHAERFTAEMLEAIKALRGRRFIDFMDAYDHGPDLDLEVTLL